MNTSSRIRFFYQRWNYNYSSEQRFSQLKIRTLNTISQLIGLKFSPIEIENKFLEAVGYPIIESPPIAVGKVNRSLNYRFFDTKMSKIMRNETDFIKYLEYLQTLFWIENITDEERIKLSKRFKEDFDNSLLNIQIKKLDGEYIIYPSSAKLLDDALVNDVLDWLNDCKKAHDLLKKILVKYSNKEYDTRMIDDLSNCLELSLQYYLSNNKSLSDQVSILKECMQNKGISIPLQNMYISLIKNYCKCSTKDVYGYYYLNQSRPISAEEAEIMIYLTGSIIRFSILLSEFTNIQISSS